MSLQCKFKADPGEFNYQAGCNPGTGEAEGMVRTLRNHKIFSPYHVKQGKRLQISNTDKVVPLKTYILPSRVTAPLAIRPLFMLVSPLPLPALPSQHAWTSTKAHAHKHIEAANASAIVASQAAVAILLGSWSGIRAPYKGVLHHRGSWHVQANTNQGRWATSGHKLSRIWTVLCNADKDSRDFRGQATPQQLKLWLDYHTSLWELSIDLLKYHIN
ncbi:hypothetical protein BT96DRAFT_947363 [Gymnopus androsaceus JB14]|uniref:Uncharacterized protein n=1 Tax=Gymnopus androsaceus JB14 TaxID=1447944 RepID=A0A6A4GSM1_9AGAR|nr:hypothetical protein BT96DRAFT_947363 [Gymnopus androsaceus JB14]